MNNTIHTSAEQILGTEMTTIIILNEQNYTHFFRENMRYRNDNNNTK